MITVFNVVYKKVEGRLLMLPKTLTDDEKLDLPTPLPILPSLAFLPTQSDSPHVYAPFAAISKLQSSVAGSKVTLLKVDILSSWNIGLPASHALPANLIFNFTGPEAEKNREIIKSALPPFPYQDSTNNASTSPKPSPDKPRAPQHETISAPVDKKPQELAMSQSSIPVSPSSVTPQALMESSVQGSKTLRDMRIERLRADEKLRSAYHDLVLSPPHMLTDEDFWASYASSDTMDLDSVMPEESAASSSTSTSSAAKDLSAENRSTANFGKSGGTAVLQSIEQSKSIETELSAGNGFLDLLMKNFVDGRLKLMLTPALRRQIYEEYPMVRVAFNSRVPSNMSAAAFWDNFFKAQLTKMLRKQAETKEQAALREKERRNRMRMKKGANSANGPKSTAAMNVDAPKLTKEEKEMQFFEQLTDATPAQLEALVWQSRASDAFTQDPSKSTNRSSLIHMLAEDDTANSITATATTVSPTLRIPSPNNTSQNSNAREDRESVTTSTSSNLERKVKQEFDSTSQEQDLVARQHTLLKQRIAKLSRRAETPEVIASEPSTSDARPATDSPTPHGAITAEEMLFSALQEQTQLETTRAKRKHSAGTQSVMDAWYSGGSSDPNSKNGDADRVNDVVELLDGIIVEAGELDDESWSELKKEKERRNRHLQLIRKFNRHGHIIVSSTSELDDADVVSDKKSTYDKPTIASAESLPADNRITVKHETPSQKVADFYSFQKAEAAARSPTKTQMSSMSLDPSSSPISPKKTPTKDSQKPLDMPIATTLPSFRYRPIPQYAHPQPPRRPSASSIEAVRSEMQKWASSPPKRPSRMHGNETGNSAHSSSAKCAMGSLVSNTEAEELISKVDQWRRHFWNLMERASATQSVQHASFSFAGAEKLAPIINKLKDFQDLLVEMCAYIEQKLKSEASSAALETPPMLSKLRKQKIAVEKCLTLYHQIQSSNT